MRGRLTRLLLTAGLVLAVAGSASAYLDAAGSGAGAGTVSASVQPVEVNAASPNSEALLPTGMASGDVKATIANPNSSPVHISSLSLDTSQGSSGFSTNAGSCALSFTTQTNGGEGWTIPASGQPGDPLTIDLEGSLTMGTSAANACQSQTFTVYLKTP